MFRSENYVVCWDREVKQAKGCQVIKAITYLLIKKRRMSYVRNIATPHASEIEKKWIEKINYYTDLR